MVYKIEYWTNLADDRLANTLVLSSADGVARVAIAANGDDPRLSTIGIFSWSPGAEPIDAVRSAVFAPAFSAPATLTGIRPGEVVRRITLRVDGNPPIERQAAEQAPAPAAFARAEGLLLELMRNGRAHPLEVLRGVLSVAPVQAAAGVDGIDVILSLDNPGARPVAIPHPQDWASMGGALQIHALRNDVPLADMRDEHRALLDLGAGQVTRTPPPDVAGRLTLRPKEFVVLSFHGKLPLKPGSYDLWGALDVPILDEGGNLVVRGTLTTTKHTITRR
jgi:hypothetical protein